MDQGTARLMAVLEQVTSNPLWKQSQREDEDLRYLNFVRQLLAWDGESERLPGAGRLGLSRKG